MNLFLYSLYEQYMNAIGQHRAILLARTLEKYYRNHHDLFEDFIKEINNIGCLSDARGNLIQIENITDKSFTIKYTPDRNKNLIIKFDKDKENLDIKSSIKKP